MSVMEENKKILNYSPFFLKKGRKEIVKTEIFSNNLFIILPEIKNTYIVYVCKFDKKIKKCYYFNIKYRPK